MHVLAGIEDIEELRRRAGIVDVDLRQAIRSLRIGDFVKLTLLTGAETYSGQPLLVRITSIRGGRFRGKVTDKTDHAGPSKPALGSVVAFTTAHIHSLQKRTSDRGGSRPTVPVT